MAAELFLWCCWECMTVRGTMNSASPPFCEVCKMYRAHGAVILDVAPELPPRFRYQHPTAELVEHRRLQQELAAHGT